MQDWRTGNKTLMDVHGAGAQRSDLKSGNPARIPQGRGPQGDVVRIYNYVHCVRGGVAEPRAAGPEIDMKRSPRANPRQALQGPRRGNPRMQPPPRVEEQVRGPPVPISSDGWIETTMARSPDRNSMALFSISVNWTETMTATYRRPRPRKVRLLGKTTREGGEEDRHCLLAYVKWT